MTDHSTTTPLWAQLLDRWLDGVRIGFMPPGEAALRRSDPARRA